LKWFGNGLFITNQGSDHLGLNRPDETFYAIGKETLAQWSEIDWAGKPPPPPDYGWPYCHSNNGRIFPDPKLKRQYGCAGVVKPYAWFPARSSALGFDYFTDPETPAVLKNAFLVSLHGSTNKDIGHGYKIVILRKGARLQDFITGFLNGKTINGRPCDIMKLSADSFLFTDDNKGVVYYVRKKR
jgi:glucose/arabinose dehydrogenase